MDISANFGQPERNNGGVNMRNNQTVGVIENLSDAQLGEIIAKGECTGEYNRTIAGVQTVRCFLLPASAATAGRSMN